jgi:putative flippase GtrA
VSPAIGNEGPLSPANASPSAELLRYILSGCVAAAAYITVTLGLEELTGLPLQATIPIGFSVAVAVNFLLQRYYAFAHVGSFAIGTGAQAALYALMCLMQYGLTAAGTALLPQFTPLSERLAYLCLVGLMPLMTFLMLRLGIFRHGTG